VAVVPGGGTDAPVDHVSLDFDQRQRRRGALVGASGLEFVVDLPRVTPMKQGDGLALEDGRIVCVEAAPEKLLKITAESTGDLVRLAWHLGNRHLPTELRGDVLLIREDHVIAEMLRGLGAVVEPAFEAFEPEAGAYSHGSPSDGDRQAHEHSHSHRHSHSQGHHHD